MQEDFVGFWRENRSGSHHYLFIWSHVQSGIDTSVGQDSAVFFDDVSNALRGFRDIYDPSWWFGLFSRCPILRGAIMRGLCYGGRHLGMRMSARSVFAHAPVLENRELETYA